MSLPWTIALITAGTLATIAIGVLVSGSVLGAVAGLPGAVVGVWQAWRHHHWARRVIERLEELEPGDDAFMEDLARLSAWPGDGRLP